MRRGTTPTHTFSLGINLEGLSALYVTYSQNGNVVLEKTLEDDGVVVDQEAKTVKVSLTQEDTLQFSSEHWNRFTPMEQKNNLAQVQIRLKFEDGSAPATNIMTIPIDPILKDGEI